MCLSCDILRDQRDAAMADRDLALVERNEAQAELRQMMAAKGAGCMRHCSKRMTGAEK